MAKAADVTVAKAGCLFASSKTCASCGWKQKHLILSDPVFACEACGHTIDRDLNTATNLRNTVSSMQIDLGREGVSPDDNAQARVGEAGTWPRTVPSGKFV